LPPEGTTAFPPAYQPEVPLIPPPETRREDESGGEFAGLASYFSSQREDDLDS